jgi:DNA-directed RNA polymerase subunit H (RpoH/RPB5)
MILVSDGGATPYIAGHREEIGETTGGRGVETFRVAELQFNVTQHALVPRHWRMGPAEVDECLRRHGIADASGLPRVATSDPVVRYYGWPRGTVVGVDRCDMNDTGLAVRSTGVRVVA